MAEASCPCNYWFNRLEFEFTEFVAPWPWSIALSEATLAEELLGFLWRARSEEEPPIRLRIGAAGGGIEADSALLVVSLVDYS